jgi:hypothetical protein
MLLRPLNLMPMLPPPLLRMHKQLPMPLQLLPLLLLPDQVLPMPPRLWLLPMQRQPWLLLQTRQQVELRPRLLLRTPLLPVLTLWPRLQKHKPSQRRMTLPLRKRE